jgi:hypothetical protein
VKEKKTMKQVITACLVMCVLAVRASPWPNRDTPIVHRSELPIDKQIEQFPEYPPVFPKAEDFPCAQFRTNFVKFCKTYRSVFHVFSLNELDSLKRVQSIEGRDTWIYIGQTKSWVNLFRNLWKTNDGQPAHNPFESNGSTTSTHASSQSVNSGNRKPMQPHSSQPSSSSSIRFPIQSNTEETIEVGPPKQGQTTPRPESTKTQFSAPSGVPDGNHQESFVLAGGTPLEHPKVNGKPLVADSVLETMFKVRELCGDVSTGCWENSIFSPLSINSISALLWTGTSFQSS